MNTVNNCKYESIVGEWLDAIEETKPGTDSCKALLDDLEHLTKIQCMSSDSTTEEEKVAMSSFLKIVEIGADVLKTVAVPVISLVGGAKVFSILGVIQEEKIFSNLDCRILMRMLGVK